MIKWQYFTLAAALGVIACQNAGESKKKNLPTEQQVNNEIKTTDTLEKMELLVLPDTFEQKDSNKMGSYILKNNLEQELIISSSLKIEKFVDDKWQLVPLSEMLVFEDITYAILPKESKEFPLALSRILKDGATVKGKYRLTKEAWQYRKDAEKSQLTAEFYITDNK